MVLKIRNLKYREFCFDYEFCFSGLNIIQDVSYTGKSTLLQLIAGFLQPEDGEVIYKGQDLLKVPVAKRPVSLIFQEDNLFPDMCCYMNIAAGLHSVDMTDSIRDVIDYYMHTWGLLKHKSKKPHELTETECKYTAIVRGLVRANVLQKSLILIDEPDDYAIRQVNKESVDAIVAVNSSPNRSRIPMSRINHEPV